MQQVSVEIVEKMYFSVISAEPLIMMKRIHFSVTRVASVNMPNLTTP